MKLWIRVDACTPRDPAVVAFASEIGVSVPTAVGHLVMLWGVMAEHTPDGKIGGVGVQALEAWAGWTGKRGKFAAAFLDRFASDGTVRGWEGRQGALIRRMEKDRERKVRGNSTEVARNSAPTERNGTEQKKQPLPAPVVAGGPMLVADKPPRAAAKPRTPAKYPHFPAETCDRLHKAWGKLGAPDYGHFRKEFARLYTRPTPDYPVEDLEAAIRDAILLAQAEGGYSLRSLTPKSFVDRAAHWVAYGKLPIVDPRTGWLSEKGDRLTRPASA